MSENSFETEEGALPVVYVLIWRASEDGPDAEEAFQERIPRLMEWLRDLKRKGSLVACGGGSFENESGGLTLIKARSVEEAQSISDSCPMNEIGLTEILLWDVFHADIRINEHWPDS